MVLAGIRKVSSADNLGSAIELCRKHSFDAAVIGHSISGTDRRHITAALREACPCIFVLAVRCHISDDTSYADVAVDAFSPEELVGELQRKFGSQESSKATSGE